VIIASGHRPGSARALGIEIWLRRNLNKKLGADHDLVEQDILVKFASDRILIVHVACGSNQLCVIGYHAPDRDHGKTTIDSWWRDFNEHVATQVPVGCTTIAGGDANGKLGSVTSTSVGSYSAQKENAGGRHLHAACRQHEWWIPSTVEECMNSVVCPYTYHAGNPTRIDYIAISRSTPPSNVNMLNTEMYALHKHRNS